MQRTLHTQRILYLFILSETSLTGISQCEKMETSVRFVAGVHNSKSSYRIFGAIVQQRFFLLDVKRCVCVCVVPQKRKKNLRKKNLLELPHSMCKWADVTCLFVVAFRIRIDEKGQLTWHEHWTIIASMSNAQMKRKRCKMCSTKTPEIPYTNCKIVCVCVCCATIFQLFILSMLLFICIAFYGLPLFYECNFIGNVTRKKMEVVV